MTERDALGVGGRGAVGRHTPRGCPSQDQPSFQSFQGPACLPGEWGAFPGAVLLPLVLQGLQELSTLPPALGPGDTASQ